jgi:transcriptional antiterminator RfaH
MNQWYVLKTKPHREAQVAQVLINARLEVFNPKIRELSYRGTLRYYSVKPLFPSYLFLHINFDNTDNIHMIKYTRGVSKILCAGNKPLPVEEEIIQTLRERISPEGVIEQRHSTFLPGDTVRIRKGPLKDLIGILEKSAKAEERVIVLLHLVNYKMQASLHWTEIEKIKAA